MKALECAEKINNELWKLNSFVLIALSLVRINDVSSLEEAVTNLEKAYDLAKKLSIEIEASIFAIYNKNSRYFIKFFIEFIIFLIHHILC